jgi:1-deoxy-D-xylulose-5-phosphate synthase
VETALETAELLKTKGISAEVINARFVKPLDERLILESALKTGVVATLEDNSVKGGFGSSVLQLINENGLKCRTAVFGFPDMPILHGSRKELFKKYRLDADSLEHDITRMLRTR